MVLGRLDVDDMTAAEVDGWDAARQLVVADRGRVAVPELAEVVAAIAKLGDPVGPLVIDDYQPEPAYDPAIGPELAASRTRIGLSVDENGEVLSARPSPKKPGAIVAPFLAVHVIFSIA